MKHCKKLLALILVVASLLSFALTANAAEPRFSDASDITHMAAVDLLSAIGVINGYEDGSFNPTGEVTRAEMAKILAFVLNGGTDVSESYTAACTFADSQSHWAKGYIGFCVSAGLINGKNANTFDPNGQVTGYEVAKMLLCALGYKADLNGLVGANWNTTTHSLAIKNNLLSGLSEYAPANPMNRDDSCRMILNALQATMVESTGSVVEIDGISIVQDVQNTPLVQTGSDYAGRDSDNHQQLVEDVFPNLKLLAGSANDAFGRPSMEWTLKGVSLGVTTEKALKNTDTTLRGKAIADAIGDAPINSAQVFVNGTDLGTVTVDELVAATGRSVARMKAEHYDRTAGAIGTAYGISLTSGQCFPASLLAQVLIKRNATISYANTTSGEDDGSSRATYMYHTEVFYDNATGKITMINNNYFYGKVASLRNTVEDADGNVIYPGYITVTPISGGSYTPPSPYADLEYNETVTIPGGATIPVLLEDVDLGEEGGELKVGDYVIYNLGCTDRSAQNTTYVAENVKLMERVTVTAEKVTLTKKPGETEFRNYDTVVGTDGVTYYPAYSNGTRATHTAGVTYDFICAKIGSRYYVYRTENAVGNYMYLDRTENNDDALLGGYVAKLVDSQGNIKIVNTDQLYRDIVGSIVAVSENAAGLTVLNAVGEYSGNFNTVVQVTNSQSNVTFDNVTKVADTATRFVISQVDNGQETFSTYVGIHKVPSIQSGQYYAYVTRETGVLDTVYILNATGMGSSVQEGMVFKSSTTDRAVTTESTYYELPAVLNGEITTVKVSANAYANLQGDGYHLFSAYTTDSYGNVSSFSEFSGTAINPDGFTPANAGIIFLNGTAMTYHENVLVYTYSLLTKTLAASTVEALQQLDYGTYTSYYTLHQTYPGTPLAAIFAIIP